MYLVVIHVPFQTTGEDAVRVGAEWARELQLLRDSLEGRFGEIVVAAPELPPDFSWNEQHPVELSPSREGIRFVRLCRAHLRARQFWPRAWGVYRRCRRLAGEASVVHAGLSDLFRPIAQFGFLAALRAGVPTVFVEDTDTVTQLLQLDGDRPRWRTRFYCDLYGRLMRWAVARADLALLKGRLLHDRYGRFARNARDFHETSYSTAWVIPEEVLAAKMRELAAGPALRCVSLGRLVPRKGVDQSLAVVARLRKLGVPVELDVLGDGPQRSELETLASRAGLNGSVRFLGSRPYDQSFVEGLRSYHLMLFTPTAEDTPRSLFDCFAAGVPVAAFDIDFIRVLLMEERCGVAAPCGDVEALAERIRELWAERSRLAELVRLAAVAGQRNAAENWYARRAQWTFDAAAGG